MAPTLLELAENPAVYTPDNPDVERIADPRYCVLAFTSGGRADVQRIRLAPEEVGGAVERVRALLRGRGHESVLWWLGASATPADLAGRLEALGLVPDPDAPVLTAMALTGELRGASTVEARPARTVDEYVRAHELDWDCWNVPEEARAARRARLPERWERQRALDAVRVYVAFLDGELVGFGRGLFGADAAFLMGGATLPHARGRGVYTALVEARRRDAVERGTPILVTQASPMAEPVLAALGFRALSTIRLYLDDLRQ